MVAQDAWDVFSALSETEQDAVHKSIHEVRMGPRAKVHRYSAQEWTIIEELDSATGRRKRPSQKAVTALRDYLPGGPFYQATGE